MSTSKAVFGDWHIDHEELTGHGQYFEHLSNSVADPVTCLLGTDGRFAQSEECVEVQLVFHPIL